MPTFKFQRKAETRTILDEFNGRKPGMWLQKAETKAEAIRLFEEDWGPDAFESVEEIQ